MRLKTNKIVIAIVTILSFSSISGQQKKNVLLICVDDLRPELKSFGADYIVSPNMDALAKNGRAFYNHYVNAPSCGPSRYTMLTGLYETTGTFKNANAALFRRQKKMKENPNTVLPSMPDWFKQHGYTTLALGKVSHHPGGRGGKGWNDPNEIEMPGAWDKSWIPYAQWKSPQGAMHGLANGETRKNASNMAVFQSKEGDDTTYPDGHIANAAIQTLEKLRENKQPFFFAVGFIRPHLPFGAPKKYYDIYNGVQIPDAPFPEKPVWNSTWHASGEFMKYNRLDKDPRDDKNFANEVKKHYAACVTYTDAQVGKVLDKLKETGLDKNTVIVLWGDHGWSLGDHAIWGKHSLFDEALHSPLIIVDKSVRKKGKGTKAIVETVDIFPTLCDLTDLPIPAFADGVSLKPLLRNPKEKGHVAFAYRNDACSIRNHTYRLTLKANKPIELFNHKKDPFETNNVIAQHPKVVKELLQLVKLKDLKRN
ncbi:sulfatase [Ochrovirga pacifica]|uniref:sulfatase n=1 Tax=Ochrovirga pacifica TaxID=1042376 RepID=UPI0002559850|nr:sulfatase [Ochrovirga pacifica]